jgi:hypothetical protein
VVGSVGLPLPALGAPLRSAVHLADKSIFTIEVLQARAVWSQIGRDPRLLLNISSSTSTSASLSAYATSAFPLLLARFGCREQRHETGIHAGGVDYTKVAGQGRDAEYEEQRNERRGESSLVPLPKQEVHLRRNTGQRKATERIVKSPMKSQLKTIPHR